MQTKQANPQFSSNEHSNVLSGSFNMDKIIQENNKKLHRYGYNGRDPVGNEPFTDLIVEELELDLPEVQNLENMARKALGREEKKPNRFRNMDPVSQQNHEENIDDSLFNLEENQNNNSQNVNHQKYFSEKDELRFEMDKQNCNNFVIEEENLEDIDSHLADSIEFLASKIEKKKQELSQS